MKIFKHATPQKTSGRGGCKHCILTGSHSLVALRDRHIAGTLAAFLSFAFNLGIVGNERHVSGVATHITAQNICWELAGAI